ncbi:tripartite motif-containing protein 2-like [Ptychodera flava]|uniref:tripartite motif-containing protein 2-like n=1 Tax=Ptychodera flava TaxID=63121 RepID=UPI00396A5AC0
MAAYSTVKTEDLDQHFLQCAFCLERLRQPKILNCLHTFCRDCLEQWVKKNYGKLICPVCRNEYPLPEEGIAGLPDNFFINNMIDFLEDRKNGKAVSSIPCHGCEKGATTYCADCTEFLCPDCSHVHRRLKVTRMHRQLSMEEYQSSQDGAFSTPRPVSCPSHEGSEIEYYCETCDVPICLKCTVVEHRVPEHKHQYCSDAADKQRPILEKLLHRAQEKIPIFENALDNVKFVLQQLDGENEASVERIREQKRSLLATIEQKERSLLQDLAETYRGKRKILEAQQDGLMLALGNLNSGCDFTENLLKHENEVAMLAVKKQTSQKIQDLLKMSQELNTRPEENACLQFLPNDKLLQNVRQERFGVLIRGNAVAANSSLNAEGQQFVTVGEKHTLVLSTRDRNDKEVTQGGAMVTAKVRSPSGAVAMVKVTDNKNGTYDITFRPNMEGRYKLYVSVFGQQVNGSPLTIDVNPPRKLTLVIGKRGEASGMLKEPWGVAVSPNTSDVVVADSGNNRVQVFHKAGPFKREFTFHGFEKKFDPLDVAVTHDDRIVISDYANKQIIVCDMGGRMIRTFGSDMMKWPWGVAVNSYGDIHVVDYEDHCLRIFDCDGVYIKTIGNKGSAPGQFRNPLCVAINSRNNIIVTDRENSRIQIFDEEGNLLYIFKAPGEEEGQFKYPTGIAVDVNDNIIVCDDWNNRVQMFRPDGTFVRRIDSDADGLRYPDGVAVTPDERVVVCDYGNDCLKVFDCKSFSQPRAQVFVVLNEAGTTKKVVTSSVPNVFVA